MALTEHGCELLGKAPRAFGPSGRTQSVFSAHRIVDDVAARNEIVERSLDALGRMCKETRNCAE
jgi:hypothetical protein